VSGDTTRWKGGKIVFLFDAKAGDKGCRHDTETGACGNLWATTVVLRHRRFGGDLSQ
jgi:hypothetical protein